MGKKGEMSKKKNTGIDSNNPDSRAKKQKVHKTHKTFKQAYRDSKERVWDKKRARVKLHHSFKRSYREDYERPLAAPGLVSHTFTTFKIIFHNWKLFGLLLFFTVFANVILVGVLSENSYKTLQESIDISAEYNGVGELGRFAKSAMLLVSSISTGGLSTSLTDVQAVLLVFLVASLWLITTYYLRHLLAGNKPRFRDGLYNALSPLISVFAVFLVMFVHLIPLFITIIVSAVLCLPILCVCSTSFDAFLVSFASITCGAICSYGSRHLSNGCDSCRYGCNAGQENQVYYPRPLSIIRFGGSLDCYYDSDCLARPYSQREL